MQQPYKATALRSTRRIVVKLGSSVVTEGAAIHRERIGRLTAELAALHDRGLQIIVVTSGARAAGLARLNLKRMPVRIPEQQAAAAIGQIGLMALYEECFADFGKHIGQVLLTAADIEHKTRYLNARHTFDHLLSHGVIPVVNENDSVATDELKFGDNDRLAALVAGLTGADLLILLTDVDGLYTSDPRRPGARLLEIVVDIDEAVRRGAGAAGSAVGTGGMASKLGAARSAVHRGITTVIANGHRPGILAEVMDPDRSVGTLLVASQSPISSRKHWIAYGTPVRGRIVVDDGAVEALCQRGSSLLPKGMVEIRGTFEAGECVGCLDLRGKEVARGLVAYDSRDCARICGVASSQIEATLGYHMGDEVIHRNDLVLLEGATRTNGRTEA